MVDLFRIAYLGELLLWVPLTVIVVAVPGMRRWLAPAIGVSALAMAYEGFMTFVWAPTVVNPIRVDLLLVMLVAALVDAGTGLALLKPARSGVHRRHAAIAAALCLGIPALALAGMLGAQRDMSALDEKLEYQRRARFEAAFRDADTQQRFFGRLDSAANPWAGYYVIEGKDDRYRHLVVNEQGRFWIHHASLIESTGEGRDHGNEFRGALPGPGLRSEIVLRQAARGYELHFQDTWSKATLPARKVAPPRFPRPVSASDEVRFVGVFSGTHESPPGFVWLVQAWLWRAGDDWWGHYVREPFAGGSIPDMLGTQLVRPRCRDACSVLEFATGRGEVVMRRVSEDRWLAKVAGHSGDVALARGELQRGFDLDLAPLATVSENRRWLEAMTMTAYRRAPAEGP